MTIKTEEPQIIRAPISKEMAYPFGFEFLREHFAGIPQWEDSHFRFAAHPTTSASDFARILDAHEPYAILCLERRADDLVARTYPARWCFTVYPVRRGLRNQARTAFCAEALATFVDFAMRAKLHPGYYNRCEALFAPETKACEARLAWPV